MNTFILHQNCMFLDYRSDTTRRVSQNYFLTGFSVSPGYSSIRPWLRFFDPGRWERHMKQTH